MKERLKYSECIEVINKLRFNEGSILFAVKEIKVRVNYR